MSSESDRDQNDTWTRQELLTGRAYPLDVVAGNGHVAEPMTAPSKTTVRLPVVTAPAPTAEPPAPARSPQARGLAAANERRHQEALARRARAAECRESSLELLHTPSGPLPAAEASEPQPSPPAEIAEPGRTGPAVAGEQDRRPHVDTSATVSTSGQPLDLLEVLSDGGYCVELVSPAGRRWRLRAL